MQGEEFAVPAQVLAEFVNVARRRVVPPLGEDETDAWLGRLRLRPTAAVDADLVLRGVRISRDNGLNHYDGVILAAAEPLGCGTVLSEDLSDGRSWGGVTVRNPFAEI